MTSTASALSYEEPDVVTILIFSSFLLLLNVVNHVLDKLIYCGLIGQIFIGVGWGIPGTNWLPSGAQKTVVQLGYIGLILIVYEGGLSTSIKALKANLLLSGLVACIGISAPIAMSFTLQALLDITPLQTFAAGAALCSTSLGTTFTVLSTSGLTESRLGVILTSAAMMDDVVGLVLVQVISTLGQTSTAFNAVTVVRPICVSIAFAVLMPLVCRLVIEPLTVWWYTRPHVKETFMSVTKAQQAMFILHTAVLIALVTGASYAGTSNLFAAYLAGACITWWDGLRSKLSKRPRGLVESPQQDADELNQEHTTRQLQLTRDTEGPPKSAAAGDLTTDTIKDVSSPAFTGVVIYEQYYGSAVSTIHKPLFFASIGFSIPITRMFSGVVVWRGFVYAVLMVFAKLICGLCLVRFGGSGVSLRPLKRLLSFDWRSCWPGARVRATPQQDLQTTVASNGTSSDVKYSAQAKSGTREERKRKLTVPKPISLYPAAILGSAMVARGEIGFLISSVAESNGVYGSASSDLFLVVTWAILLCTLFGPITVGLLVKRIKRCQKNIAGRPENVGRQDALGVWGIL